MAPSGRSPDKEDQSMTGFRVLKRTRKVDGATVDRFRSLPVANVSDVMARMVSGGSRLRPLHAGGVLAGPALTVKTRPGDNLMLHKALDIAEPGDVVVVDAGGDLTNSLIGERSEEHTSELQSRQYLVCRLLLEKK